MAMITIVGCGPGALDHLPPVALQAISEAEVLVGARRLLQLFSHENAEQIVAGASTAEVLDQVASRAGQRRVVVLVTGDPGVCSLSQPVIQRFGRTNCRVIPGISSVQVAFARLGLDWFGARLLTAHRQAPEVDSAALAGEEKIVVLAGNPSTALWITQLAQGLCETHIIFLCQDLTLPDERVHCVSAEELARSSLSSRTIVLFVKKEILA